MAGLTDMRTCAWCQTSFRPKKLDRDTCCSRECGYKWLGVRRSAYAGRLGRPTATIIKAICVVCGGRFSASNSTHIICSASCRTQRYDVQPNWHVRTFSCVECGNDHSPEYGDKRRVFCSDECRHRAARRVRRKKDRARLRGATTESVNPTKVFERDGWRCQICRIKTPRSKRGSYDERAPELDHIVPLASGGEHSYANTQCACRKCNAAKANTTYGQLNLFVA